MISIPDLNAISNDQFTALLGGIYEHSEWVAKGILDQRPFPDASTLQTAMRKVVDDATHAEKLTLIRAHPDLAGKLARAGALTAESTREQAGLGLDRLSESEYLQFADFNRRYLEQFGFPFIICARKTTKQGVLDAFAVRLGHTRDQEISEALRQIHQIAALRLADLLGGCAA
jgi:2-oxo-4-hydroxy-4-carboxy-5-ureidoimidazoline decarboxylase